MKAVKRLVSNIAVRGAHDLRVLTALALVACTVSVLPAARAITAHAGSHSAHTQGYLGIEFHDLTDSQASALHLKGTHGVEVAMVDHDGPAGKAGLRPHDIILSLNGKIVASAEALRRMIHEAHAGMSVMLSVMRDGQALHLTAQLADRESVERDAMARMGTPDPAADDEENATIYGVPPADPPARTPRAGQSFIGSMIHMGPFTGVEMESMTPQLAGYFGAPQGTGLLVTTVTANSPASDCGLHAGDVVLRADDAPMHSSTSWSRHLRANKGHPIILVILRDKHEQTLTLVLDSKKHSQLEWPTQGFAFMQ